MLKGLTPAHFAALFLALTACSYFTFLNIHTVDIAHKVTKNSISPLRIENNRILRADTGESIILKGAVSDFFRYQMAPPHDLRHELQLVASLKTYKANVVGLYFDNVSKLKEHIQDLDAYVDFTAQNGIYLYFMPVARDFRESYYPVSFSPQPKDIGDLTELITFLSSRYKDNVHILYGFGAEPDLPQDKFEYWYTTQERLARIVRGNDPDAILLISGVEQYQLGSFKKKPFPFENVIYQTGGYMSADDADFLRRMNKPAEYKIVFDYAFSLKGLEDSYPILVGEFGGNALRNFSSETDLLLIKRILTFIHEKNLNYTAYRLGAHVEGDNLSLFDTDGVITKRGNTFLEPVPE